MAIKTTGAEFKRFLDDPDVWDNNSGDVYCDEIYMTMDGEDFEDLPEEEGAITPEASIKIFGGRYCEFRSGDVRPGCQPIIDVFNAWKKKQSKRVLVVEIDASRAESLTELIKSSGGMVV